VCLAVGIHGQVRTNNGGTHMQEDSIQRFFGIPGHQVRSLYFLDSDGHSTSEDGCVAKVIVELSRVDTTFHCRCGRTFTRYYDFHERFVRDLPWGPWPNVYLLVPRFRVACPECGIKTEPLDWIPNRRTYTKRLAQAVALACREVRSISAIAQAFGLSWDTVKEIDKAHLERDFNPPDLTGVRHLALDEFSIRRRHTYATIFLDVERSRVLWVCRTREKHAVKEVFEKVFGQAVCEGIEAVSMDWWEGYEKAFRESLPHAKIVWDLFHIIKKYNHDVVDRVRLDEAKRCQTEEEQRTLKRTKFILVKNRANLVDDEPARLKELLAANKRLASVYILRDALKKLWEYVYCKPAEKWFGGWFKRATDSRIEPLKKFAHSLKERLDGILAHCSYPLHTGILEGVNNTVKVIKRVSYGFRDQEYFFLKIRAHFDGDTPH
jgi:transposase